MAFAKWMSVCLFVCSFVCLFVFNSFWRPYYDCRMISLSSLPLESMVRISFWYMVETLFAWPSDLRCGKRFLGENIHFPIFSCSVSRTFQAHHDTCLKPTEVLKMEETSCKRRSP